MTRISVTRTLDAVVLAAVFLRELVKSAVTVAGIVARGGRGMRPAILAVPLDVRGDTGIAVFADMVTLTPGTTSLHVSDDRRTLYVHAMDAPDPAGAVAEMKAAFETRVLKVFP
ncbi:MAG: Na+/H+ antiporter subunit E [Rhodospirillales bacterium]|jgi:multicomponent Na+:H+ antiporter subunit E